MALDCPELTQPSADTDSSPGFPRCSLNRWLRSEDGSADFHVIVEIVSPKASSSSGSSGNSGGAGMRSLLSAAHESAGMSSAGEGKRSKDTLVLSDALRDCRECEYQLGLEALDPLFSEPLPVPLPTVPTHPVSSAESGTAPSPLSGDVDLLSLDDMDFPSSASSVMLSNTKNTENTNNNGYTSRVSRDALDAHDKGDGDTHSQAVRRMDYAYPLSWLDHHIQYMGGLIAEVSAARKNAHDLLATGCVFRPSTAKKIIALQAIPVNLHMQVIAVRASLQHSATGGLQGHDEGVVDPTMEGVLDALTCGCLSPHGLGFSSKKGLDGMEGALEGARVRIDGLKGRYFKALEKEQGIQGQGRDDDVISSSPSSSVLSLLNQDVDFMNSSVK